MSGMANVADITISRTRYRLFFRYFDENPTAEEISFIQLESIYHNLS